MANVSMAVGGPVNVSYFTDDLPDSNEIRLAAVAIWRNPRAPRVRGPRGILSRLREKLGPRGIGLHFRWNVPTGVAPPAEMASGRRSTAGTAES
jgi:hypothetical protein